MAIAKNYNSGRFNKNQLLCQSEISRRKKIYIYTYTVYIYIYIYYIYTYYIYYIYIYNIYIHYIHIIYIYIIYIYIYIYTYTYIHTHLYKESVQLSIKPITSQLKTCISLKNWGSYFIRFATIILKGLRVLLSYFSNVWVLKHAKHGYKNTFQSFFFLFCFFPFFFCLQPCYRFIEIVL